MTRLFVKASGEDFAVIKIYSRRSGPGGTQFGKTKAQAAVACRGGVWGWQVGRPPQTPLLRGPSVSGL